MPNGNGGGTKIPTWLAIVLAMSGVIVGTGGGIGASLLKISENYVTKAEHVRALSALEHRTEVSQASLNDAITKLDYQVMELTKSLTHTNTLLARLDERMCDDGRSR